ncbi:MAG: twin-arginine translocase TatA/TatE family subunit [Acidimicrobiaceae bacterium]|nr:twin-arginine translocase TatA/TatE family subunit [Acidimicrobiaceae bacterium]MEC7844330.1 twin-arginine translocase TatA/TatE family subunit [Actinomycetota bacterium]|tara:strand:+ start:2348 stop:2512 length:165 start_codon:yes stop_codon:yes gene_type:complete
MGSIGTGELIIILAILLVFFGGKKLPGLARSLGKAQKEFKEGQNEDIQENEDNE